MEWSFHIIIPRYDSYWVLVILRIAIGSSRVFIKGKRKAKMYNVLLRVLAGEMRALFGGTLFLLRLFS